MAYVSYVFVSGEVPTVTIWNQLWANDASFNNGTGIADLNIGSTTSVTNAYKFSVYQAGALNTANGAFAAIAFDTKLYDTGSNYATATGKFVAPVAGYYQFNSQTQVVEAGGGGHRIILSLYKNGSEIYRGTDFQNHATSNGDALNGVVSTQLQLAANDYVQVYEFCSGVLAFGAGYPPTFTVFSGFLSSNA